MESALDDVPASLEQSVIDDWLNKEDESHSFITGVPKQAISKPKAPAKKKMASMKRQLELDTNVNSKNIPKDKIISSRNKDLKPAIIVSHSLLSNLF